MRIGPALVVAASLLVACGASSESETTRAEPAATAPPREGAEPPAAGPRSGAAHAGPSPSPSHDAPTGAVELRGVGWGASEPRTFVLQGAARGDVGGAALTSDGAQAAIGGEDGTVAVIDVATGAVRASSRVVRSSRVRFDLALTADTALVTFHSEGSEGVSLWRWREGTSVELQLGEDADPLSTDDAIALAPRGDRVLVARSERAVIASTSTGRVLGHGEELGDVQRCVWPTTATILAELRPRDGGAAVVAALDARGLARRWQSGPESGWDVSRGGDRVATLEGEVLVLRATATGEEIARIPHGWTGRAEVVLSRDGDRVALASDARSVVLSPAAGAPPLELAGRVRWMSRRNALVESEDGELRRWVFDRARLGTRIAPRDDTAPRLDTDGDGEPDEARNEEWIGESGAVVLVRGRRLEIVDASGRARELAQGGEHSVWSAAVAPGGRELLVGGRFGTQLWSASGVRSSTCAGDAEELPIDWSAHTVLSGGGCELATDRRLGSYGRGFVVARTEDLRHAITSEGDLVDLAAAGRGDRATRRAGLPDLSCSYDTHYCSERVLLAPGARAIAFDPGPTWDDGDAEAASLHDVAGERVLARFPAARAMVFAPDGAYLAHASPRSLRVISLAGDAAPERTLAGPAGRDLPDGEDVEPALAVSLDGRAIAWAQGDGRRVRVVRASDGAELDEVSSREPVTALRFSRDGRHLAVRTRHGLEIRDVAARAPASSIAGASGSMPVLCAGGRIRVIRDAAGGGGLEVLDVAECRGADGLPALDGSQGFLVWRSDGAVRVTRLSDRAELYVRTLRDAGEHHLAHDAEGRWWTDEPATDAAPVPTWVRRGDGAGGETRSLDAALRHDDLLRAFFGADGAPPG